MLSRSCNSRHYCFYVHPLLVLQIDHPIAIGMKNWDCQGAAPLKGRISPLPSMHVQGHRTSRHSAERQPSGPSHRQTPIRGSGRSASSAAVRRKQKGAGLVSAQTGTTMRGRRLKLIKMHSVPRLSGDTGEAWPLEGVSLEGPSAMKAPRKPRTHRIVSAAPSRPLCSCSPRLLARRSSPATPEGPRGSYCSPAGASGRGSADLSAPLATVLHQTVRGTPRQRSP